MHQIIGLREKVDPATGKIKLEDYSIFHKYKILFANFGEYLKDPKKVLSQLPQSEHHNLFFTVAHAANNKRSFSHLDHVAFDFDKIDLTKLDHYIELFCKIIKIPRAQLGIVCSGNGLHFYVGLLTPITDAKFYKTQKLFYKAICTKLEREAAALSLPLECDPTVFEPARILRLPGTMNAKAGREPKPCYVIEAGLMGHNLSLPDIAGIPEVEETAQLPIAYKKMHPKTDNKAILNGCKFMEHVSLNPHTISEPQWYAALSITARMENGRELSHTMSRGHKKYSKDETDTKIDQALAHSGPRLCRSIDQLWEGCKTCPHYEQVESPILLTGPDFIKTEATGFHNITVNAQGVVTKRVPNHEDLMAFFIRQQKNTIIEGDSVFVFNGKYYEEIEHVFIEQFALTHFQPAVNTDTCKEFRKRFILKYVTQTGEVLKLSREVEKKLNFENGILDLRTNQFMPHGSQYYFKNMLPYDYEPGALCPTWDKFLNEVTCFIPGRRQILEEFFGYALSGDRPWLQKALFLIGGGSNGKSALLEVIQAVFGGDKNVSNLSSGQYLNNNEKAFMLEGKLLNICEEMPKRAVTDSSSFKNVTSGGIIFGRKLYHDGHSFSCTTKFVYTTNNEIESTDTTYGIVRRLLMVNFAQKFSDNGEEGTLPIDRQIVSKLLSEKTGIVNCLLAAYGRLVKRGAMEETDETRAQLQAYRELNDPIFLWLKECVEFTESREDRSVTPENIYKNFCGWYEAAGYRQADMPPRVSFSRRLYKLSAEYKVRKDAQRSKKISGKVVEIIHGIRLLGPDLGNT